MPGFRMRPSLHPVTGALEGFTVHDRYPRDTTEWVNLLAVVVTHAALHPVSVPRPMLFAVLDLSDTDAVGSYRETLPDDARAGLVEDDAPTEVSPPFLRITALGAVADPAAEEPLRLVHPLGAAVLHPLGATRVDDEEERDDVPGSAAGCLLLPGIPEVGLDHRAAWAAVREDGLVSRLTYTSHASPALDPDVAYLSTVMAAA
ncbi:MAG: hypothetical protein AB7O74_07420 [Candidatus Nanopelagicales bacterium]